MLPADLNLRTQKTDNDSNLAGKVKVRIIIVFLFIFTSLVFGQLVFANSLATDGQKLSDIYDQIEKLEDENTRMKMEIAKNSSLTNLTEKAQESGFQKPSKVIAF